MRWILGLLVILALPALAVKPLLVGYSSVDLIVKGNFPETQRVYIPQPTEMQDVFPEEPINASLDRYGNRFALVTGNISWKFKVISNSRRVLTLEDSKFPRPINSTNMSEYLKPTDYFNSDSPAIISLAQTVTRGAKTSLEAIGKLMLWVNSNIEYDQKYSNEILSGVETLKAKKGVCDEMANLYISLARSVGLPSRLVIGLVNTGSGWRLHSWAETEISGTWVPVDPTFAEMGQIDATHIVLYRGPSYPFFVSPSSKLSYSVVNASYNNYTLNLSTSVSFPKTVRPRQIFDIVLTVKNNENFIVTPTYLLQTMKGFDVVDGPRKFTILYPGEEKNITWRVVAPYGERKKYFIGIVGPMLDLLSEINVSGEIAKSEPGIRIEEVSGTIEDDKIDIMVNVENQGNTFLEALVTVSAPGLGAITKEMKLPVGERDSINFKFPAVPGTRMFSVSVEAGNITSSSYLTLVVPGNQRENLLTGITQYLVRHSKAVLVVFAVLVIVILLVTMGVPAILGRKLPFREAKKWERLLKLERR